MKAVIRVCLIAALVAAAGPPAAQAQQPAERTGAISPDTRSQVVDS